MPHPYAPLGRFLKDEFTKFSISLFDTLPGIAAADVLMNM